MTTFLEGDAETTLVEPRRRLPSLTPTRRSPHAKIDLDTAFTPSPPGVTVDLAVYWRSLIRRKWTVAISLLAALAIGAVVTLLTRPLYTAQTTLQIDREAEKVVSREEAMPQDNLGEEFYQTQYGLLRSRAPGRTGGADPRPAGRRRLHRHDDR